LRQGGGKRCRDGIHRRDGVYRKDTQSRSGFAADAARQAFSTEARQERLLRAEVVVVIIIDL